MLEPLAGLALAAALGLYLLLHPDPSRTVLKDAGPATVREGDAMTILGWLQILLVLAAVVTAAVPLGRYIARVMAGERTFMSPVLAPVERGFYTLWPASTRSANRAGAATRSPCWPSAPPVCSASTPCSACKATCR